MLKELDVETFQLMNHIEPLRTRDRKRGSKVLGI